MPCGLDDRCEFGEHFEHRVGRGVIVRRIRFEERQGSAERDCLGYELPRSNPRMVRSLGGLPDRTARAFARGEQGDRGTVQLGRSDQLEAELEGGKPEAEGLTAPR